MNQLSLNQFGSKASYYNWNEIMQNELANSSAGAEEALERGFYEI